MYNGSNSAEIGQERYRMRLTQEDKELFRQACERGNQSVKNRDGIGTLKEKTVHAVLKHYIEPREQYHRKLFDYFFS